MRSARRHVAVMEHDASVIAFLAGAKDQTVDDPMPQLEDNIVDQG